MLRQRLLDAGHKGMLRKVVNKLYVRQLTTVTKDYVGEKKPQVKPDFVTL